MSPLWRHALHSQLEPGETVAGWFEPDLDADLRFADGIIAITNQRFLAAESRATESTHHATARVPQWRSWPLKDIVNLRSRETAGLGSLELLGETALEGSWSFTAAKSAAATQFVSAFHRVTKTAAVAGVGESTTADAATICPSCGSVIEPPQTVCETCMPSAAPPPVRSLWRLGRFARPRAPMILLGFALTLASTAAALVWPYLTILLVDNVLTPRQNGVPVEFKVVYWYLAGMFGAAVLAWLLSWAKTYVLASVSEQISADLRNETYSHLQLSVDQSARLRQRRAHDRHDGDRALADGSRNGHRGLAAVSDHRLDGAEGAHPFAAWVRAH